MGGQGKGSEKGSGRSKEDSGINSGRSRGRQREAKGKAASDRAQAGRLPAATRCPPRRSPRPPRTRGQWNDRAAGAAAAGACIQPQKPRWLGPACWRTVYFCRVAIDMDPEAHAPAVQHRRDLGLHQRGRPAGAAAAGEAAAGEAAAAAGFDHAGAAGGGRRAGTRGGIGGCGCKRAAAAAAAHLRWLDRRRCSSCTSSRAILSKRHREGGARSTKGSERSRKDGAKDDTCSPAALQPALQVFVHQDLQNSRRRDCQSEVIRAIVLEHCLYLLHGLWADGSPAAAPQARAVSLWQSGGGSARKGGGSAPHLSLQPVLELHRGIIMLGAAQMRSNHPQRQ